MTTRLAAAREAVRADRTLGVVAAAAVVGAVLRVVWVLIAARRPTHLYDPARYVGYAEAIARGDGMIGLTGEATAYFPPGYPYALGAVQAVLVHTPLPDDLPLVAGLLQALLGTASIVMVAVLGRRLHSAAAGAVAALCLAVYPNLVLHTAAMLSETLAIALLLGLLVVLVPPPGDDPWPAGLDRRRLVAAGLLLGALLLVRPVSAGVVLALGVALLVARVGVRRIAMTLGVVLGIAVLCVVPWTIRNAVRLDAFVAVSTNTGDNFCMGHGPGATGGFRIGLDDECATGTGVQHGIEGELRNDREKTRRAFRLIRENWQDEPRLAWERMRITFADDDDAVDAVQSYDDDPWIDDAPKASRGRELFLRRVSALGWAGVGIVGAVGMVMLAASRRPDRLLVPLTAAGLLLAPLATFGDIRFKAPVVPLLILAAAVAVVTVARAVRGRAGGDAEVSPPGAGG